MQYMQYMQYLDGSVVDEHIDLAVLLDHLQARREWVGGLAEREEGCGGSQGGTLRVGEDMEA